VTLRELNRTLLLRQMLLERRRISLVNAVKKLVALQAQYAPSPYVALWSRVEGFRKVHLTESDAIVWAATLRGTQHVMARECYPYIAAAYIESRMGRTRNLGVDLEALRKAMPRRLLLRGEAMEIAERVLRTDDEWTRIFALRALPFVREGFVGPWPHAKPPPIRHWKEALPDRGKSAEKVVRAYVAAYGPASRFDIEQFTGFRVGQINPALEGLIDRDGLYDVPRAPIATGKERAPVRFLPAFDSMILAHRDRARIVPLEYTEAVFNKKNATTKNTFTVDGFVAGAWRIEKRKLIVEPFAPLPVRALREVDAEGARLLAWYSS
jgi:hypothetical protein